MQIYNDENKYYRVQIIMHESFCTSYCVQVSLCTRGASQKRSGCHFDLSIFIMMKTNVIVCKYYCVQEMRGKRGLVVIKIMHIFMMKTNIILYKLLCLNYITDCYYSTHIYEEEKIILVSLYHNLVSSRIWTNMNTALTCVHGMWQLWDS